MNNVGDSLFMGHLLNAREDQRYAKKTILDS